ncbi:MAG: multidrug effflux MFS transporter [Verrucomicrobium sp.]|nr:multidrug effflux MFS transporter [Verrucomicrobium sp.]
MKLHRGLIALLAFLAMLGPFSIDTYLPSFPAMGRYFGVGPAAIQQTLTVFLLAMAVMTLFHGTLSDAWGRRPIILAGLSVYALASVGAALAPRVGVLVFFRLVQGLSVGVGIVVGRAMIRDRLSGPEAQKAMSTVTAVFGLAPLIAPLLGGWLEVALGWRSVFVFMGLYGALLLTACGRSLKETLVPEARVPLRLRATLRAYGRVAADRRFLSQCLGMTLASSMLFLYVSAAPVFLMQLLHLPPTAFAWLFTPLITGMTLGAIVSGKLAHRWPPKRTIWTGYGIMGGAVAVNVAYNALAAPAVPWAVLPIMVYTFGMALASPAMTILTLDLFPANRGLTASLQAAIQLGTFSLIAGVVAPLIFHSGLLLAVGAAAGWLAGLLCWKWGAGGPDSAGEPKPPGEVTF